MIANIDICTVHKITTVVYKYIFPKMSVTTIIKINRGKYRKSFRQIVPDK